MDLTSIQNITNQFVSELKNALTSTNASGKLSNSITGLVKQDGKYINISIQLEDYWKYVENGTKPHFPPIDKIRQWIKVKPVLPRATDGKLPTQNQLAYLISRKISKVGTKPQPFLKNTLSSFDLIGKIYNEVTELINKQLIEEIDNELE